MTDETKKGVIDFSQKFRRVEIPLPVKGEEAIEKALKKPPKVVLKNVGLDEVLLAGVVSMIYVGGKSTPRKAVLNALALYRKATPAEKAEMLGSVLSYHQSTMKDLGRLRTMTTMKPVDEAEHAQFEQTMRWQCEWLELKIAALREGQDIQPVSDALPPPAVEAVPVEVQKHYIDCSADLYHQIISAVGSGDFERPGPNSPCYQTALKTKHTRADLFLKPHDELEYSPAMGEEALQQWQERMAQAVSKLNDETADVLDILTITWLKQAKNPNDRIWVRADDILRLRGRKPRKQGGYKQEDKAQIRDHINLLAHLRVRVFEMPRVETVTTKAGRTKDVMKYGQVDNTLGVLEGPPIGITLHAGQQVLFGEPEYTAWRIFVGDVLAPFFHGPGRQVALLSAKALTYNPRTQRIEKRLTRYFSWQWRIRAAEGNLLQPFKVKTLVEEVKLKRDKTNPRKPIDRLVKALDTLTTDEVIKAWQYQDGFEEPYDEKGGWEKWLAASVTVEPPQVILNHAEKLQVPKKKALPVPKEDQAKAKAFDPARLKQARQSRGLTQLQAVEEIQGILARRGAKVKLSRSYYSMLEAGKKDPQDTLKKILVDWSEV